MTVRPLTIVPISAFRSHTKACLNRVTKDYEHLKLTYRGKGHAAVIPIEDALVLWQLQGRPLKELEDRMAKTYAAWTKAKAFQEAFDAAEIDGSSWRRWAGFQKL